MAGDLNVGIRLTADGKGFVGEIRVAQRELDKLTGGTRKAGRANTQYAGTARRVETANRRVGKSFLDAHGHTLKYLVGIGGITAATRGLLRQADSYTQISNAVRIATGSAAEHAAVSDELFDIAQRTRAPLTAVADLYQKLSISAADLGASNADMLQVIEGVGQALVINGTSAAQASGALLQLSQALGGGVVRAEELNSVLEGAKPILIAVANNLDAAGGSVSKLRALVAAGEVTSRAFFEALKAGLPELAEDFEKANSTIGQGFVQVDNAMTQLVGRTDEARGASIAFAGALESLAEQLAEVDADALAVALQRMQTIATLIVGILGVRMVVALGAYTLSAGSAAIATFKLSANMVAFNANIAIAARRAGAATAAFKATRRAALGLGRGLALFTGPIGWITIAATGFASLAFSTREASDAAREYARIQERIQSGASGAAGGGESPAKQLVAYAEKVLRDAQEELRLVAAAGANVPHDATRNANLAPFEKRVADAERILRAARARVERAASLQLEDDPQLAGAAPAAAPDTAAANAAAAAFRNLQRRLLTEREAIEAEYAARRAIIKAADAATEQQRTDAATRALTDRNRAIHEIYLRGQAELQRAEEAAEQERRRELTASGLPALAAARERQKELAAVTDLSAVALQRQAAKTRITEDVLEEFGAATQQVQQAIIASRLAIEQQESALERMAEAYQAITGNAAAYAQQLRDLNAAEQLALANAANSGAKPAEIAAAQADIARGADLERERLHTEQHLANHRNRWERQIRDAQGYRSAIEQAEDAHQKNLLGLQFANQPQIAAIAQRHSQTITALDRGEEVSAKKKFKFGLDLAQEGLSQAAQYSKKAWKLNQLASITSAVINTYEGITKALSALPPPFSFAAAAAVGAAGFAQVAAIRAQQPPQGFARGGIVDRPTFFTARGVPSGVAGEAGPEAILPLRRGPGGRLGVHAGGGLRPVIIRITIGDVHVQAEPGQQPLAVGQAVTAQVLEALAPAVRSVITNEQRPGGLLNRTDKTS
ncbi:MAG: tape measure protein [Gammaproteobacteria bacterium]|nr:tape measure protein [Gammaproteobacteria bacterium]